MVYSFDFTTIDTLINSIGLLIEAFISIIGMLFNNFFFIFLFCFAIAFIWALIRIFDFKRYIKREERR